MIPHSYQTVEVSKESLRTDFEAILSDLQRNTRYNIIIQAFNKKGPGPGSDGIITQTAEYG